MEKINYTIINHQARIALGLTMNEYAVAELVYHMSHNPSSDVLGWCYASKKRMGLMLSLSEQSVHAILVRLMAKGLIEKHPETRHLKTTIKWYESAIVKKEDTKESLATLKKVEPDTKESLAQDTKESLANNNIYNKNNNNTGTNVPIGDPPEKKGFGNLFVNEIIKSFERHKGHVPSDRNTRYVANNIRQMIEAFVKHNQKIYYEVKNRELTPSYTLERAWLWFNAKEYAQDVEKLETFKLKLRIFLDITEKALKKEGGDKNDQQGTIPITTSFKEKVAYGDA